MFFVPNCDKHDFDVILNYRITESSIQSNSMFSIVLKLRIENESCGAQVSSWTIFVQFD